MSQVPELLFNYLKTALYNPEAAVLNPDDVPREYRTCAMGLVYYVQSVHEVSQLAADIAKGELDTNPLSSGNEVAPGIKSLQATMRHLTWQAQQIAKGDYQQRVDFMGDLSEAINNMVMQLDERQKALEAEIDAGLRKSKALALSLRVLEDITRQMPQLVVVIDRDSKETLFQNHPMERVLHDISTAPTVQGWIEDNLNFNSVLGHASRDLDVRYNNGYQFFLVDLRTLSWGNKDAVVFIFTDMTNTRRAITSLEELANFDQQTNVYSRHYGMMTLNRWIDEKIEFVLGFVDMDSLKYVNDEFGHVEGDKYILEVASLLRSFDEDVFVARLGGDEFMVLAQAWEMEDAERRMEELRDELIERGEEFDPRYRHSLSYGVIKVESDNVPALSDLLSVADEKMYMYKRARKAERKS